jgi:hypothetical protein
MIRALSDSQGHLFLNWARIYTDKTRWPFVGDLIFAFFFFFAKCGRPALDVNEQIDISTCTYQSVERRGNINELRRTYCICNAPI